MKDFGEHLTPSGPAQKAETEEDRRQGSEFRRQKTEDRIQNYGER
jgi:hypothetical protein